MSVEPSQVAEFDQKHAKVSASLDVLVSTYQQALDEGEARHLTIVGQLVWLVENFEPLALAEHLSVAIARLANR